METKRPKIVACKPLPNYCIWIRCDDGLEGEVDLNHLVGKGVFESWNSIDFFNQVRIDPLSDTVAWGEGIDLDPDVLREKIASNILDGLKLLIKNRDFLVCYSCYKCHMSKNHNKEII